MPRGIETPRPLLVGHMGRLSEGDAREGRAAASTPAIEAVVDAFATAWFEGDAPALAKVLHPGYANHILHSGEDAPDLEGPTMGALTRIMGVQAAFGPLTPAAQRTREVKVLDVRQGAASILAVLGDWLAYLHLSRTGERWAVVNVLWNWQPGLLGHPAR